MNKVQKKNDCYVCGNDKLVKFFDLGSQPPSDAFLYKEDLEKEEVKYPLELYYCKNCSLVQLGHEVNPDLLFRDYVYNSGTNNSLKLNFKKLVDELVSRFDLMERDLAIDIGSNDGTLLENYLSAKVKILGIDPSSATSLAIAKGIPTVVDFFNNDVAERVKARYGKSKIITATNVFAHVGNLKGFMTGVECLLETNGVFVNESHYLLDILEKLQYDSIYHEHLRYYSLASQIKLFEYYGLEVFDVQRIGTHNGSLRVFACRKGTYPVSSAVNELFNLEKNKGVFEEKIYFDFAERALAHKEKMITLVQKIIDEGKNIFGIGAPAKGNTLLNFCEFGTQHIECLVERSELKIGTFAPGSRIPVLKESLLIEKQPDYALILSWNLTEELIGKLRSLGYKGKFIVPFPEPMII